MRSVLPTLVKVNLSNSEPTGEQLNYLFSSLSPVGMITSLNLEQVDLTGIAPELFAKAANLVDLNLGDTVVNVEQIQAVWSAVEQAPDLQLNKLSTKSMDLSTVSPQALRCYLNI